MASAVLLALRFADETKTKGLKNMKRLYEYSVKRTYVGAYETSETYSRNNPEQFKGMLELTGIHSQDQESFLVIYLDNKNKIKGYAEITTGLINRCHVHPREVFKLAVLNSSAKIAVAHNHPSGDLTPSQQDIDCTLNLIEAGEILGIPLIDSFIVGETMGQFKQLSLRQNGVINFSS